MIQVPNWSLWSVLFVYAIKQIFNFLRIIPILLAQVTYVMLFLEARFRSRSQCEIKKQITVPIIKYGLRCDIQSHSKAYCFSPCKVYSTSCCLFCTCLTSLQLQVHMTKWRAVTQRINSGPVALWHGISSVVFWSPGAVNLFHHYHERTKRSLGGGIRFLKL
jgi:hypothetical protein